MAFTLGEREIRPLTADEAMDMVRAGIIGEDERVELLHGVLTRMSPQQPPHAVVVQRLTAWLAPLMVAGTHDVRVQLPFAVPDPTSLPEPDVAVVARTDETAAHPTAAALIIEVAHSSLRTDTRIKPALYGSAGVPEYWVVDVAERRLHVLTDPAPDGYGTTTMLDRDARVTPTRIDGAPLALAELLRGIAVT